MYGVGRPTTLASLGRRVSGSVLSEVVIVFSVKLRISAMTFILSFSSSPDFLCQRAPSVMDPLDHPGAPQVPENDIEKWGGIEFNITTKRDSDTAHDAPLSPPSESSI